MDCRSPYRTLGQPLIERAQLQPDQMALVIIEDDGTEKQVSVGELHGMALTFARALDRAGIEPGDLVALVLMHSVELVGAFWGVLYLGAIPSILPYLTEKMNPVRYAERVEILIGHAGAKAVLASDDFTELLQSTLGDVDCQILSLKEMLLNPTDFPGLPLHTPSADETAVLLFSSGTTGIQKGVAISHRAFLQHHDSLCKAIDLRLEDVIVSWLPLYHDLGLIGSLLLPIIAGVPSVIMSSFYWVRSPTVLLKAIQKYDATVCWMPNFGFNHTARSVHERDKEQLDLSSMRFLMNSAEPVRYDSIECFLEAFEHYGMRREAIGTGYGMVENGGVTISRPGEVLDVAWVSLRELQERGIAAPAEAGQPGSTPIVSCGFPMQGVELKILDEDGIELPERYVGEVALRSEFMFKGYHRRLDLTKQAVREGWFFSGDMGFLAEGQLYITGRKKDLIIVAGKCIYPEDIEEIANTMVGVYPGRAAAFGLDDQALGSERIMLLYEAHGTPSEQEVHELERSLRRRVLEELDVTLGEVLQVERGWIVKAPSGKIARRDNRKKYLARIREG